MLQSCYVCEYTACLTAFEAFQSLDVLDSLDGSRNFHIQAGVILLAEPRIGMAPPSWTTCFLPLDNMSSAGCQLAGCTEAARGPKARAVPTLQNTKLKQGCL